MPVPEFPSSLWRYGTLRVIPERRTVRKEYTGGQIQRDLRWLAIRYRFEIAYEPILPIELAEMLIAFWDRMLGGMRSFYFRDWTTADQSGDRADEMLGLGNGDQTLFKLHEDRVASAAIYVDGALQIQGATPQVVVDPTTGLVTFTTAPAADAEVTADVEGGDFRVIFDGDELPRDRIRAGHWATAIKLVQSRAAP